ncbi:alpha-tectorin-like [Phyllopteryx taeniolatus]|uniref:alpha-tectorin-like n=1 Tax=Phyllopteryx taeniolatus TaxID=161469 RepID=UPI002AD594AD|nr:alpha-tectorin-like [Phyllopteryx taeniolatus]XP_061647607.1 alpha-tectorin-like [Phyllopteryx taeniolatus]
MKANVLLLLLAAVVRGLFDPVRTDPLTNESIVSLIKCPLSIFGKLQTNLSISQSQDATKFCFTGANPMSPDCIKISGANEDTVESEIVTATSELEALVKAELPQLNEALTCYLISNLSTKGNLNMTVTFMQFGSQTVLSVYLASYQKPYVLVQSLENMTDFKVNFTKASGEETKYLDLSGCRFGGQVIFPASNTIISENCTNFSCSAQGQLISEETCASTETCTSNNTCKPSHRACTVTGGQVIQFFGQVSTVTDRCLYSLLEPVDSSSFVLLAAFEDRRSLIMTFLDRLDLVLPSSNIISLETSGRVRVNGQIQTVGTQATEVHGVLLSGNEAGVTLEILNTAISAVNVSIFFDGSSAYITVPDGAPLQGLCGNANDPAYLPTVTAASQSKPGCDLMPRISNLLVNIMAGLERCSLLTSEAFAACHRKVPVEPHILSCNNTLSGYPMVDNLQCQFFEAYAQVCKQQYDIDLGDWRSSVNCQKAADNQAYCQNHTCNANEFCGESGLRKTSCLCRAIFAAEYKLKDTLGDPPTCQDGSASISLIGCLLEENDIDHSMLHLRDETCKGERDSETHLVTFSYNSSNTCGTEIQGNESFVVFKNRIGIDKPLNNSIITRNNFQFDFTCVYRQPDLKTLSFQVKSGSVTRQVVSQAQNYTLLMQAYVDSARTQLLEPGIELELNQQVWIQLTTDGLDGKAIKMVTQSCWVTKDSSPNDTLRYDLIVDGCPNLQDGTVDIEGNGLGKDNYFLFRMFQFLNSRNFYLHCNVTLCAKPQCAPACGKVHSRRRRALKQRTGFGGGLISLEWII